MTAAAKKKTNPLYRFLRWVRNLDADTLGWIFFLLLLLALLAPAIWLTKRMTYEDTSWIVLGGLGFVWAAIGAGVVSWLVTAIVNRVASARAKKRRKQRKKK